MDYLNYCGQIPLNDVTQPDFLMVSALVYINTNKKNNHPCYKIPCFPYAKRITLFSPDPAFPCNLCRGIPKSRDHFIL